MVYVNSSGVGTVVVVADGVARELVLGTNGSVESFPFDGELDGFTIVDVEDVPEYGAYFDAM